MKLEDFRKLTQTLGDLTPHQKQVLSDKLRAAGQTEASLQLIESRVGSQPVCPRCAHDKVVRHGVISGLQRYRCKGCGATFNALTGTPLSRLRHKDKWLEYASHLTQGASVRKAAEICEVHPNTTFRWRHRFLALPDGQKSPLLAGIAEADETVFLQSFKGKRKGLPRDPRKRGGKAAKRGLSEEQIPVLICRDRTGATTDFVLEKADSAHIGAVLKPVIAQDAMLCTDGGKALCAVAKEMGIPHQAVNLAAGIRVIDGVYHVQNVNAYDSRLKQWMQRFHGVATRHLAHYLGWRRLIERHRNAPTPTAMLAAALGMTYQQLTVT